MRGKILTGMTSVIKLRLALLAVAIVVMALLVAAVAYTALRLFDGLNDRLTRVHIESFRTADQFRASLKDLDLLLLRGTVQPDPELQTRFLRDWTKINSWIDQQRPSLSTTSEKEVFDQIDAAYDDYFNAATNLLATVARSATTERSSVARYEKVELASNRLLEMVYQLAGAHRESLKEFLSGSRRSLSWFRGLLFGALGLLLGLGVVTAVMVYRDLIHPLRMKLVESHAIIERQEKLASLGTLAAGVAHEIRNPLTAIKARLFTQKRLLQPDSAAFEDASVIGTEINRLEKIVKDFLTFARPTEPALVETAAEEPLREVQVLLAPQLAQKNIRLTLDPSTERRVIMDAAQIKQALINLIQNAADSIGEDGDIRLRVRRTDLLLHGQNRPVAVLEVSDTGKGIAPEVEKRLFDPFFTTKAQGTGLGLSIAARIVQKQGGLLEYQTRLNHGTTFGIALPLAASA